MEIIESEARKLTRQISDLMTLGNETLTQRQEDMLFFALRALDVTTKRDGDGPQSGS
jgi:hypothetical protein